MPPWSTKGNRLRPPRQVLELLLEDPMRQARNQALVLIRIPSSNRRPNGGDEPDALHSTTRVDKEEHQGVGGVPTYRRERLQPCKTFDYRQVPLRGRLRLQPVVPIGHSTSSSTRAHVKFLSYFWKTLCAKLGIKLLFSSAYHPQTDGQTEVTNRTLSTLLHVLIKKNIKEWEECLPIAENAYNRARHSTTGKSPFEVVYGFNPLSPLDILPLPLQERTNLDTSARASYIKKMHEDTRHTIECQVQQLATKLNVNKQPMVFNIGDLMWLHLRNKPRCECTSKLSQEDARRYKARHRAPSTTTSDQAQRQQATHDLQHWRSHVATPSQGPLPQPTQVQASPSSRRTFQGASMLQDRFPNQRKSKLLPRADGPFKVLACYNNNAYKIDLPRNKYNMSDVFNVKDLSPYHGDEDFDPRSDLSQGGKMMQSIPRSSPWTYHRLTK